MGRNPPVVDEQSADATLPGEAVQGDGEFLTGAGLADLRARCQMLALSLDAAVDEQR